MAAILVDAVISKQGDLERVFYLLEQGAVEESLISQEGNVFILIISNQENILARMN